MHMTHNEALEILAAGNEDRAYEVAMQDEGINPETTKEQWLAFAYKCLENRANGYA
jgi:hypothetical protein